MKRRYLQLMAPTRLLLTLGVATLCGACATTGAKPRPFPTAAVASSDPGHNVDLGQEVVRTALELRGVPYRDGGSDVRGFDCSGFTQYVFDRHGIHLPRAARDQFKQGRPVTLPDAQAGDLLFFSTVARGPSHVAIALGGGAFVHAPSTDGVVRVEYLSEGYWSNRFFGVRRFTFVD